jgi:GntR family transcriptional regulator
MESSQLPDSPATSLRGEGKVAYQALADELRRAISAGDFAGGKRLPTEAELSARYQVSRQTVRRAHQDLVSEGLIYRVRGRGTYATPVSTGGQFLRSLGSIEDLLALSVDTTMELVRPLERRADISAASRLGLESDQVMRVVLRRFHDDEPFCITEAFFPLDIGRRVAASDLLPPVGEGGRRTMVSVVDDVSPEPIVKAQQSITAHPMPSQYASLIDCEPGQAVLLADRLFIDAKGRAVELSITHYNPERYSYRLELRRSIQSR